MKKLARCGWMCLALALCAMLCVATVTPTAAYAKKPSRQADAIPKKTPAKKIIYLTFDDGPSKNTKALLNVLKKHNVKATFFIIGSGLSSYPKIVKREHKEGHTVGNHTYSHNYKKLYSSKAGFFKDFNRLNKKLKKTIKTTPPKYLRFPGGGSNTVSRRYNRGIMKRLVKSVHAKGWRYYDWNVSSGDAEAKTVSRRTFVNNVKKGIKGVNKHSPKTSAIVLMHDTARNKHIAKSIDELIEWGHAHGYYFAPLSDKTPQIHHKVAN